MSSQRYSEARSYQEENRRGTNGLGSSFGQEVTVPIQHSTSSFSHDNNEQRAQERIRHYQATVQWVNDPVSGKEKFRVNIETEGFKQNEINYRVEGNKLLVFGEHVENSSGTSAKKITEKSIELPHDIDTFSPHVTFPTTTKMQIDFPTRYSNTIIDDGRTSSKLISNNDTFHRSSPGFGQQKSSTEYTSTRRIGGGNSNFERNSSPRSRSPYDQLNSGNSFSRDSNLSSSTSQFQSREQPRPLQQGFFDSKIDSFTRPLSPINKHRGTIGDSFQTRSTFPTSFRDEGGDVREQSYSESHREVHHQRSSPTTGVQSSHEVEDHRSGSPSLARKLEAETGRFKSSITLGDSGRGQFSSLFPSSSRNLEEERGHFRSGVTDLGQSSSTLSSSSRNHEEERGQFRSSVTLGDSGRGPSSSLFPSSLRNLEEERGQFRSGVSFGDTGFRPSSSSSSRNHEEERGQFRSSVTLGDSGRGPSSSPLSSSSRNHEEERGQFRSGITFGDSGLGQSSSTLPSSSRNLEVREFSRRLGSGVGSIDHDSSFLGQGFNSDAFYRSAFQPKILTDEHGQKCVEMKLDVSNYEPSEIKVSVNGNDLVVQAEHSVQRPPSSSSRAYFYKQVTLPTNTDLTSLSSKYHPDGKLQISAKISHGQSSIRNN